MKLERAAALGIVDNLRRRFARFKLGAHFLDLRGLFCSRRSAKTSISFASCPIVVSKILFSQPMVASCSSFFRCALRNSLSNITLTARKRTLKIYLFVATRSGCSLATSSAIRPIAACRSRRSCIWNVTGLSPYRISLVCPSFNVVFEAREEVDAGSVNRSPLYGVGYSAAFANRLM